MAGMYGKVQQQREKHRAYQAGVIAALAIGLLLVGALMAMSTGNTIERLWRLFDPEAREIARQELAATSDTRVTTARVQMWLSVAIKGVLVIYAAAVVGMALVVLVRRSRAYYAHDGLFPTVEIAPGHFYDINRALGEDAAVTAQALEVQRHQAMASAGPFPALPQQPQASLRSQAEPGLVEVIETPTLDDAAQSGLLPAPLARAIDGQWREVGDAA